MDFPRLVCILQSSIFVIPFFHGTYDKVMVILETKCQQLLRVNKTSLISSVINCNVPYIYNWSVFGTRTLCDGRLQFKLLSNQETIFEMFQIIFLVRLVFTVSDNRTLFQYLRKWLLVLCFVE